MTQQPGAPAAAAGNSISDAEHQAALAAAQTTAKADGEKAGALAAQTRIKNILGAKEADGRKALAEHFAFNTAMSTDDAIAALAVAPKEKVEAARGAAASRLDSLMQAETPKVDTSEGAAPDASAALSAAVTRQLALLGKKPLALN